MPNLLLVLPGVQLNIHDLEVLNGREGGEACIYVGCCLVDEDYLRYIILVN